MPGPTRRGTNGLLRAFSPKEGAGQAAGSRVQQMKNASWGWGAQASRLPEALGLQRFYTEDSPGLEVDPVPVLVTSLLYLRCTFGQVHTFIVLATSICLSSEKKREKPNMSWTKSIVIFCSWYFLFLSLLFYEEPWELIFKESIFLLWLTKLFNSLKNKRTANENITYWLSVINDTQYVLREWGISEGGSLREYILEWSKALTFDFHENPFQW